MSPIDLFQEHMLFLGKFLHDPVGTGSIAPSSRFLTKEMLKPIRWENAPRVAELGAGTGVFTRAIQRHLPQGGTLHVFERDDSLRERLTREMPCFTYHADALNLRTVSHEHGKLDAVISGLPFANFPKKLREDIIDGVCDSVAEGGSFTLFQYTLLLKPMLKRRFRSVRTKLVALNVPPAFVHICTDPL